MVSNQYDDRSPKLSYLSLSIHVALASSPVSISMDLVRGTRLVTADIDIRLLIKLTIIIISRCV